MPGRLYDERAFEVPPDALFALLTDPAFQEARSRHLGTLRARCTREDDGDAVVMILDEVRATGWEPHRFESRRTTRWDPIARTATWTLAQTGGPGDTAAEGRVTIREDGPGRCRLVLEGTLRVRVPVIGSMIERVAARAFRGERAEEGRFITRALAGRER